MKDYQEDLYRHEGKIGTLLLIRYLLFTAGYRYTFLFRKTKNTRTSIGRILWNLLLRQTMLRTGIQIPIETKIGRGLRIVHFGHIVINPKAVIGINFNVFQGVTIGSTNGKRKGSPIIGDNVVILPNAVVVGKVTVGDNVLIAPNSFVNFDVPDNSVVLGNPGKIISKANASKKYIVFPIGATEQPAK